MLISSYGKNGYVLVVLVAAFVSMLSLLMRAALTFFGTALASLRKILSLLSTTVLYDAALVDTATFSSNSY